MNCKNCLRLIAVRWIFGKYWYHVDTGREQCAYDDLTDIRIAEPQ